MYSSDIEINKKSSKKLYKSTSYMSELGRLKAALGLKKYNEKDKNTIENLQSDNIYMTDCTSLYPGSIIFRNLCPESIIYHNEKPSKIIKYKEDHNNKNFLKIINCEKGHNKEDPIKNISPIKSLKSLLEILKSKEDRNKINMNLSSDSGYCTIVKYTIETSFICKDSFNEKNDYTLLKDVNKIYISDEKNDNYIEI